MEIIIDPTLPVDEFIGQAIGAASTCWSDMAGQGVFESERALQIRNEILAYIDQIKVDHRYKIANEVYELAENKMPNDDELHVEQKIRLDVQRRAYEYVADRIRNPHLYGGATAAKATN
jgi:hypothetical protein